MRRFWQMAEEQKSEKREKRRTATKAAAMIGPMVKEFIGATHRAKQEGKKLAYTFICCFYEEIIRAMDIVPVWTENFAGICGAKRDAERFLARAESLDFSRSLCTYALCGIGFDQWREELESWGRCLLILLGEDSQDLILCSPAGKSYVIRETSGTRLFSNLCPTFLFTIWACPGPFMKMTLRFPKLRTITSSILFRSYGD
jgi:hypothetical protein